MVLGNIDGSAIQSRITIDDATSKIALAILSGVSAFGNSGSLPSYRLVTEAVFLSLISWEWITKDLVLAESVTTMVSLSNSVVGRGIKLVISSLETVVDQGVRMAFTLTLLGSTFNGMGWISSHWNLCAPFNGVVGNHSLMCKIVGSLRVELNGLLTHCLHKV